MEPLAEALEVTLDALDVLLEIDDDDVPVHVVAARLSHLDSLVQGSGEVRMVELGVVPDLLQSPGYAAAVERATEMRRSPEDVQRLVGMRMRRQQALSRRDPLWLRVLMPGWILADVVGSARVMVEQLERMLDLTERPNVDLRLLGAGSTVAVVSAFTLLTKRERQEPWMAVSLDLAGPSYHEDPGIVSRFVRRFDKLSSEALEPRESLRYIKECRESHMRNESQR